VAPLPGSLLADCLQSGKPTMADFGEGWCKPCQQMEPILHECARDYAGRANIVYVDMAAYPQIAKQYGIRIMPTQVFFGTDGKEASRHIGVMSKEDIARRLSRLGVQQ
jgi:thioredoxin 1